ncbi:hypothetical protein L3X38_026429 [Prunus dulcis]|uniref:Uncharacterized protein n=1 Tax=Prunus dulcis TaxID=3755 RepID=A0AAD4VL74_PRUDU|nr:hypothetical protein L3X38_026429 [Prunus dulcis]
MIKLPNGHDIPSANELKNKTFCKWHNVWSHATNSCLVFRNVVHDLIDRKVLKFPEKAIMGVDQNPFANAQANMVNANFPMQISLDQSWTWVAMEKQWLREEQGRPRWILRRRVSRCQCEVSFEVIPPKAKEPSREPTRELAKEQVQTIIPKSAGKNMMKSPAEN